MKSSSLRSRYAICRIEVTRSSFKKMEILYNSDDWEEILEAMIQMIVAGSGDRMDLQLVEKEDSSGVLFFRISAIIDGRPFCQKPEEMGPDKYGYQ